MQEAVVGTDAFFKPCWADLQKLLTKSVFQFLNNETVKKLNILTLEKIEDMNDDEEPQPFNEEKEPENEKEVLDDLLLW